METGENQLQVFSGFHTPLGIRQTAPDSHIPTAPAAVAPLRTEKTKTRKESAASQPPNPNLFQDHLVLETLSRFRIIRRLENAALPDTVTEMENDPEVFAARVPIAHVTVPALPTEGVVQSAPVVDA